MKASLLRLALIASVCVPAASAFAADLDPPPPVDDLRPATYDWTGVSIGVFGAANAVDGHYDATQICDNPNTIPVEPCNYIDPEMSGIGYGFGLKAGVDYQMDSFVIGLVGDWSFNDRLADNDDPAEATYLDMNHFGTLRARAGLADDRTLFYVTGGVALAEMEFGGLIGPANQANRENVSDAEWVYGWTIGGGIEHAFSDSLSAGLEYLYVGWQDSEHMLFDSTGTGGRVDMFYNDMHTIRASLNYRFTM
jgi:outer membrane immunogenic protein